MDHEKKRSGDTNAVLEKPSARKVRFQAIVQCDHYRCIGFQKDDGTWVDLHGDPLFVREVVSWIR